MVGINHILAAHMSEVLYWISLITALMYVSAMIALRYAPEDISHRDMRIMSIIWLWLVTLYWVVISIVRVFFDYIGPTPLVTLFAAFLFMMPPSIIIWLCTPTIVRKLKQRYRKMRGH